MALPSIYSDDDIIHISAQFDEAGKQEDLFQTVKCCLIGAQASVKRIVTVAVHPGYELAPRSFDLYVGRYIDHSPVKLRSPKSLALNSAGITRFPATSRRKQRFEWSLFYEDQTATFSPPLPRNRLYDTFKCDDGRRSHYGNIMVVKTNHDGVVVDVKEEDLYFIEVLTYSYLEEIGTRSRFPVLSRPVLDRCKPKKTGWEVEPQLTWGVSIWNE